ncbi:hypothetical protein L345_02148, partial [Ophiophagus hannah]
MNLGKPDLSELKGKSEEPGIQKNKIWLWDNRAHVASVSKPWFCTFIRRKSRLILLFWSRKSQPMFVAPTVSSNGQRRSSRWERWSLSRAKRDKVASQPNLPASLRGEGVVIVSQPYMLSESGALSSPQQSSPLQVFPIRNWQKAALAILYDLPLKFYGCSSGRGSRRRFRIIPAKSFSTSQVVFHSLFPMNTFYLFSYQISLLSST